MKKIFEKSNEEIEMIRTEEEPKMSFFEKHKKGLFFGVITLATTIVAGVIITVCGNDSDAEETEDGDVIDVDGSVVEE